MTHSIRGRSIVRLVAAVLFPLLLTVGASCNAPAIGSPFIPIPPPNPTFGPATSQIDSDGIAHTYWKVTSPPSSELSDLWVYLANFNMGVGASVQAAQDGSYRTQAEGQPGDWIEFGFGAPYGEASQTMCRPLREGLADTPLPLKLG